MVSIAVIIPTHNRPLLLKEAIKSVEQQTRPVSEIIVVDDASQPPVDEAMLKGEFGENIKVLRNEKSHGLAWVRHQGVEASTADIVAHLDDDDLYAPSTIEEGVKLLNDHPELEVIFLGVKGFGERSDYFNNVQSTAVKKVIEGADGEQLSDNVIKFGESLLDGLLMTVPSAFQHVLLRRDEWNNVSQLRRKAYCLAPEMSGEQHARQVITGPLRDSEWALYAGVLCKHSALIDKPCYLARCEGQGLTSQPDQRERHLVQNLLIRENLYRASQKMPVFAAWKAKMLANTSQSYFDAAYYYICHGQRISSLKYLIMSYKVKPMWSQFKLLVRVCFMVKPRLL